MPRPSSRVTEEQRKLVKSLSAMGLPQEHICAMVGVRSPKTLRKHFEAELVSGMAEANAVVANAVVARVAYDMAVSGRFPAMSFFWTKCQRPRSLSVETEEQASSYTTTLEFHYRDPDGAMRCEKRELHA
ncbi:MAG: hypothetical protein QOD29_6478 [Alphaproteobacteria bacterium]|nr:hypothetical protein [Alphaproteobacteria bacterium]